MNISAEELAERINHWDKNIRTILEGGNKEIVSPTKEWFIKEMTDVIIKLSSPIGHELIPSSDFIDDTLKNLGAIIRALNDNHNMDYRFVMKLAMALIRAAEGWKCFL